MASAQAFAEAKRSAPGDNWLCYLPMAWLGDSPFTLGWPWCRVDGNCPESPETVQRDLRELGPTVMMAPPRIWENMLTQLRIRAADSSPLKRHVFEFFRGLAERAS